MNEISRETRRAIAPKCCRGMPKTLRCASSIGCLIFLTLMITMGMAISTLSEHNELSKIGLRLIRDSSKKLELIADVTNNVHLRELNSRGLIQSSGQTQDDLDTLFSSNLKGLVNDLQNVQFDNIRNKILFEEKGGRLYNQSLKTTYLLQNGEILETSNLLSDAVFQFITFAGSDQMTNKTLFYILKNGLFSISEETQNFQERVHIDLDDFEWEAYKTVKGYHIWATLAILVAIFVVAPLCKSIKCKKQEALHNFLNLNPNTAAQRRAATTRFAEELFVRSGRINSSSSSIELDSPLDADHTKQKKARRCRCCVLLLLTIGCLFAVPIITYKTRQAVSQLHEITYYQSLRIQAAKQLSALAYEAGAASTLDDMGRALNKIEEVYMTGNSGNSKNYLTAETKLHGKVYKKFNWFVQEFESNELCRTPTINTNSIVSVYECYNITQQDEYGQGLNAAMRRLFSLVRSIGGPMTPNVDDIELRGRLNGENMQKIDLAMQVIAPALGAEMAVLERMHEKVFKIVDFIQGLSHGIALLWYAIGYICFWRRTKWRFFGIAKRAQLLERLSNQNDGEEEKDLFISERSSQTTTSTYAYCIYALVITTRQTNLKNE
eukprot:TRINITY_DN1098_c0_g1_i11.p1 TRINITY_DN1098_c0_g1~~TRINITY_DN1098_c0_g1_i11.p1  ORF type:complete len:608 (-),score=195.18 TRINITY_DN1098_c0_g1_i11:249-2072(-)